MFAEAVMRIQKIAGGFALLIASVAFATPPTPPATVNVDVAAPGAASDLLPLRIEAIPEVRDYRLRVFVRSLADSSTTYARAAATLIHDESAALKQLSSLRQIPVRGVAPGEYELDVLLTGSLDEGERFSHRELQHLTVSRDGNVRIEGLETWAQREETARAQAFRDALSKHPSSPRIRLLMGNAVPVPAELAAKAAPSRIPENLRRPPGPATRDPALSPYYVDAVPLATAAKPLEVRGRLFFQDFDGVFRPIVNATVQLWDEEYSGAELLGVTLSDGAGSWSISIDNNDGVAEGGRDLFFTAELANSRVSLTKCPGRHRWASTVFNNVPDVAVINFAFNAPGDGSSAATVFSLLNQSWNHTVATGGQDPGPLDACFPAETTGVTPEGLLKVQASDFASDHIPHEYGHFVMLRAHGEAGPAGVHRFLDCFHEPDFMWSEGWANGFALMVIPDGVYDFDYREPDSGVNFENVGAYGICRVGEKSEVRIAAALNDMIDPLDDDAGNNPFLGRIGYGDRNAGARISLASMIRDTLWGRVRHDDVRSFWGSLAGNIPDDQQGAGDEIMYFNYMTVPPPDACVAEQVSAALLPDPEPTLGSLRGFRDRVLKPLDAGRELVDSYYRNSAEMALLALRNREILVDALRVVQHLGALGDLMADDARLRRAVAVNALVIPPAIAPSIERMLDFFATHGGATLAADTRKAAQAYATVRTMSVESLHAVVASSARSQAGS
jgi:hypothetical protein